MKKVIKTNVMFFTSSDYKDAKKEYEKFVNEMKPYSIGVYFNDDEDMYKMTIIGAFGDVIHKDVYSWDELSQLIHDNI